MAQWLGGMVSSLRMSSKKDTRVVSFLLGRKQVYDYLNHLIY